MGGWWLRAGKGSPGLLTDLCGFPTRSLIVPTDFHVPTARPSLAASGFFLLLLSKFRTREQNRLCQPIDLLLDVVHNNLGVLARYISSHQSSCILSHTVLAVTIRYLGIWPHPPCSGLGKWPSTAVETSQIRHPNTPMVSTPIPDRETTLLSPSSIVTKRQVTVFAGQRAKGVCYRFNSTNLHPTAHWRPLLFP